MSGISVHSCWEVCTHLLIRSAGRKGTGRGIGMSAKPTWWVGQPDMKKVVCSRWFQLWDWEGEGESPGVRENLAPSSGALQVNRAVKNTQKETAVSWRALSNTPGSCKTWLEAGSSWGLGGHRHVGSLLPPEGLCRWGGWEKWFFLASLLLHLLLQSPMPLQHAGCIEIDSQMRGCS